MVLAGTALLPRHRRVLLISIVNWMHSWQSTADLVPLQPSPWRMGMLTWPNCFSSLGCQTHHLYLRSRLSRAQCFLLSIIYYESRSRFVSFRKRTSPRGSNCMINRFLNAESLRPQVSVCAESTQDRDVDLTGGDSVPLTLGPEPESDSTIRCPSQFGPSQALACCNIFHGH